MSASTPPPPDRPPPARAGGARSPRSSRRGPSITVRVTRRGGTLRIRLSDFDAEAVRRIRRVDRRRWNPSDRVWEIPDTPAARAHLRALFPEEDGDYALTAPDLGPGAGTGSAAGDPRPPDDTAPEAGRDAALAHLERELLLRGRSPRTRKLYLGHVRRFLEWLDEPLEALSGERIRDYLVHLARERRVSRSYQNQAISAIRFLCEEVLGTPREVRDIPRPRRPRRLPRVLSRAEVERMLAATRNRKHRAILMLLYSAGLRVSEVVRLRPEDLDLERGMLFVSDAKGGKDRYTLLSRRAFEAVREYRARHRVDEWLFPGPWKGRHLTSRTVQRVVERAAARAGIERKVTPHVLRHCFATHLLEAGVGLRQIQELLGHASSRTTEIYTHVTRRDLARIRSPLDLPAGDRESPDLPVEDDG